MTSKRYSGFLGLLFVVALALTPSFLAAQGVEAEILLGLAQGRDVRALALAEADAENPQAVKPAVSSLADEIHAARKVAREDLAAWSLLLEAELDQAERVIQDLGLGGELMERLALARHQTQGLEGLESPGEEGASWAEGRPILRASQLPYRSLDLSPRSPDSGPWIVPSYGDATAIAPGAEALAGTLVAPLASEILLQAEALEYDPVRIYEFVHGEIETEWYAGAMKGALGTLRQGSGNDVDQAALLIALLRASSIPAHFVVGVLDLPLRVFEEGLGLEEPAAVSRFLVQAGVAHGPTVRGGVVTGFQVEATWVSAYVPYSNYRGAVVDVSGKTWIPLAPALKRSQRTEASGVLQRMPFDIEAFLEGQRLGLQEQAPTATLREQIEAFLLQEGNGETLGEQLASRQIKRRPLGLLPSTLPAPTLGVTMEGPALPNDKVQQVRMILRSGPGAEDSEVLRFEAPLLRFAGSRLTLAYQPATDDDHRLVLHYGGLQQVPAYLVRLRPQLRLAGRLVAVGEGDLATGIGHRWEIELLAPGDAGAEVRARIAQTVTSGGYHAVAFGAQRFVREVRPEADSGDTEYLAAQLLDARAYDYGARWDESEEFLAALLGLSVARPLPAIIVLSNALRVTTIGSLRHRLQWEGVTVDAAFRGADAVYGGGGPAGAGVEKDWRRLSALEGSALEHFIFEDAFLVDAVSADKGMALAREAGIEVLLLTSPADASQIPSLTHPAAVKKDIDGWLRSGFTVEVPRHPVARSSWVGSVWRVEDPASGAAGYFLSGGLAGGATAQAPGTWALQFLEDALAAPLSPDPNTDPQAAVGITKVEGSDGQEGEVGELFDQALTVRVTDDAGRPVQGASVTFSVSRGGGLLSAREEEQAPEITVLTDAQGLAAARLRSGQQTASNPLFILQDPLDEHRTRTLLNVVEAVVEGRLGPALLETPFFAYGYPKEPVTLRRTDSSSTTFSGFAGLWSDTIAVAVEDVYGNPVSNVEVLFQGSWQEATINCPGVTEPIVIGPPGLFDAALDEDGGTVGCPVVPITIANCGSQNLSLVTPSSGTVFAGFIPGKSTFITYRVQASFVGGPLVQWDYEPALVEGLENACVVRLDRRHVLQVSGLVGDRQGRNISATRPGERFPRPIDISVLTFLEDYELIFLGTGVWRAWELARSIEGGWYPAKIPSIDQVEVSLSNGGLATDLDEIAPAIYRTLVEAGPEPGLNALTAAASQVPLLDWCAEPNEGQIVELRSCRDGCYGEPLFCVDSQLTSQPRGIFGVEPQIVGFDPEEIVLTAEGRTAEPVNVGYQVLAPGYPLVPVQMQLLENGTFSGIASPGSTSLGPGVAVLDRGLPLDLGAFNEAEIVLNPGSVAEVRSDPVSLPLAQQIFADVPRSVNVTQDVDVVNRRVCSQPSSFAFTTTQEATLTLTFRRVESLTPEGDAVLGSEVVVLNGELRAEGQQVVALSPTDLPPGDYRFELRGVSSVDGHVETREGKAVSELRSRDVLPVGHVLVKGVDLFDGHLVVSRESFRIPGRGVPLSFQRTYSSSGGFDPGNLGVGWVHNWESQVVVTPCGEVIVIGGEGSGQRFVADGSGGFLPLKGYHGSLVADSVNNTFDFYSKSGNRWHYAFDGAGAWRLTEVRDLHGNVTSASYVVLGDGRSHVESVTDSSGRSLLFAYDYRQFPLWQGPVLTSVRGPDGLLETFEYNGDGNLVEARREGDAQVERYRYELVPGSSFPLRKFLRIVEDGLDGGSSRYSYVSGAIDVTAEIAVPVVKVLSVREPKGGRTTFRYGASSAEVTDRRGKTTTYTLNSYGSATEIRDPLGAVTQIEWSPDDIVMTRRVTANGDVTDFTYDGSGNLLTESTAVTDADGVGSTVTKSFTYWQGGVQTEPGGNEICFVTGEQPSSEGCPVVSSTVKNRMRSRTSGTGAVTEYFYDPLGSLLLERIQVEDTSGALSVIETRHGYAPNGDRLTTEDARGNISTFRYDGVGNLNSVTNALGETTTTTWDARSLLRSRTDPRGNTTTFDYDRLGRLTKTTFPQVGAQEAVKTTLYDDLQNLQVVTDAEGRVTTKHLDLEGRVVRVDNAEGGTKVFEYDPEGNKVLESSWFDSETQRYDTVYTFDDAGRLATRQDPEGRLLTYFYDPVGNRTQQTLSDTGLPSSPPFLPRVWDWEYDELNRPILERRLTEDSSIETKLFYDGEGNKVLERDPLGREMSLHYDGLNRLIELADPLERRTIYGYDGVGNKTRETLKNRVEDVVVDQVRRFSFDAADRLATSTDAEGAVTRFEYDEAGNLERRTNPLGDSESYAYDARNRLFQTTRHLERVTVPSRAVVSETSYDRVGNLVEERRANGRVLVHVYDALDRLTSTTDQLGLVASVRYDARGNVVFSQDAEGRETITAFDGLDRAFRQDLPEDRTLGFAYDVAGNRLEETDARGAIRVFEYDRLDRLVGTTDPAPFLFRSTSTYDAVGNLVSSTDRRGHTSTFQYDALNRLIRSTAPDPLFYVSETRFDSAGNPIRETDRRGIVTELEYDRENRLLRRRRAGLLGEEHAYDAVGNRIRTWDAKRNLVERDFDERGLVLAERRPLDGITTWVYDDSGDAKEIVDPEGRQTSSTYDLRRRLHTTTNGAGETTTYGYDGVGNRTLVQRPEGEEWIYAFDDADRLASVTDPLSHETSFGYDANGNRTSITDAAGQLTSWFFDSLNRASTMTYVDGSVESYGYDPEGNRRSRTDALGRTTITIFDPLNRETLRTFAAGSELVSIATAYDGNGNRESVTESFASGEPVVTTQTWDDFDRLESVTDRFDQHITYRYDANGNRTRLGDPAGGVTVYTYDSRNRLASVTPAGQGPTVYTWKKNSLPESVTYPNGVVSTSGYDLANRVASITNTLGATAISSLVYDYDGNGNRVEQIEIQSGVTEATSYFYDEADRLEEVAYPDQVVTYGYDEVGNRRIEIAVAGSEAPNPGETLIDRTFSYNDRHQLEGISDALDPSQNVGYSYDANGNQSSRTTASASLSFLYDHRDQLEEVQKDGLLLERYVYDYRGLRIRKAGPAGVEQTTYDDTSAFWRTDDQGLRTATYHWGADRLLSLDSTTEGLAYYLQDALGSPTNLLGADGTLKARYQYDAWGNPRGSNTFEDLNNPFAFTGYEEDPETGLLYAKARYYDPAAGRFLTQDPFAGTLQTPPSLHKYLYAYANPTVYTDPTGRIAVLKRASNFLGELQESLIDQAAELNTAPDGEGFLGRKLRQLRAVKSGVAAGVAATGQQLVDLTNTSINLGIVLDKVERDIDQGELLDQAIEELGLTIQNAQRTAQVVGEDPYGVAAELAISAEEVVSAAARGDTRAIAEVTAFGTQAAAELTLGGKGLGNLRRGARTLQEGTEAVVEGALRRTDEILDIRPGDRLPDGRIAGDGPGAALKDGPEFGSLAAETALTAYHGTDVDSALRFLRREGLDVDAAASRKMDGPPGFFLATNMDDAVYFGSRRSRFTVLQYDIQVEALKRLREAGSVLRPIAQGQRNTLFAGDEILVPPSAFEIFNSLIETGEVRIIPADF